MRPANMADTNEGHPFVIEPGRFADVGRGIDGHVREVTEHTGPLDFGPGDVGGPGDACRPGSAHPGRLGGDMGERLRREDHPVGSLGREALDAWPATSDRQRYGSRRPRDRGRADDLAGEQPLIDVDGVDQRRVRPRR